MLLTLAGGLEPGRFERHLVVLDGRGPLAGSVAEGVTVHDLGRDRLRAALPALAKALRRLGPATVVPTIWHLNLAVLALRPLLPRGTRILAREANTPSASLGGLRHAALFRAACRRLYPTADAVLCNAERMAEEVAEELRVPMARIRRLDNPVDEAAIRARAAPVRREAGPGARLVAAGRLTRQKGFDRLIDAMADAPGDAMLSILGDGPDRPALARRIAERGLAGRVLLAGFEPEPWSRIAGADAFLLSSRWEGMPNAALEALACGTKVIAAPEAGGIAEVADDAPAGAVRLARFEDGGFAAALAGIGTDPPVAGPRPSLLPARFRKEEVLARFAAILEEEGA